MKRSWIGFVLLLVLLAGGIAATWGMAKCHEPIARDLENAAKTALQGDMAQGEVLMLRRGKHGGAAAIWAPALPTTRQWRRSTRCLPRWRSTPPPGRKPTSPPGAPPFPGRWRPWGRLTGRRGGICFKKLHPLASPYGRGGRAQEWSVSLPIRSIRCFTTTQQICAVLLFFIQRLSALRQCDDGLRQFPGGGQRLVVGVPGGTYLDQQTAGGQILVEPLAAQL